MGYFSKTFNLVKEKLNFLWGLKFTRDTLILQVGSVVGTGLSIIASVIYARILGVTLYGDYALIFALVSLVGLFMDWGASYAAITLLAAAYARQDRQEIKDILTYFFKLSSIIFFTVGLAAIIFCPLISQYLYHNPAIGKLARIVLVGSSLQIFFSLLTTLLQVMRKMKYLIIAENVFQFFTILPSVVLVLLGYGLTGIVWGYLAAIFGSIIFSLLVYHKFSRRNNLVPSLLEIFRNFSRVKIARYFSFGFFMALDKNISSLFGLLPLMILGYLATSGEVANLKIALAYLTLPNILVSPISRLLQVQLPKAKEAGVKDLKANFYNSSVYSGLIFVFLMLGSLVLAPFLISTFYGSQFGLSIKLVYPLSLSVIFSGFAIGFGSLYRTIGKNIYSVIINVINIIIGLILVFVARKFTSPLVSVAILIIYWGTFALGMHMMYIRNYFRKLKQEI